MRPPALSGTGNRTRPGWRREPHAHAASTVSFWFALLIAGMCTAAVAVWYGVAHTKETSEDYLREYETLLIEARARASKAPEQNEDEE